MAHLGNVERRSAQGIEKNRVKWKPSWLLISPERIAPAITVLLILMLWEWLAYAGRISALFFPAPSAIFRTLIELISTGELFSNLVLTVTRLFSGFVLGAVPALILGLLMGWSSQLRTIFDPIIAALHPIPKIAILPLIIIIFGIGETSKIVVVAIATFFPVLINSMAGVLQINPTFFEVARNYGAKRLDIFKRVVYPGSLPLILSGVRIALNTALMLTIAVELVFARQGLGAMIWLSWQTLRTETLYASIVVISVLGISFNFILLWLKMKLVPWHKESLGVPN
jgi:ABC-type nitrate/sulfonate/bicarbonate transport system permease component